MNWKHLMLVAGGSAAAAGVLYYLLRDEDSSATVQTEHRDSSKVKVNEVTKEQVLKILSDIIRSQDKMKAIMKDLTQEILKNDYDFEKTYDRVRDVQPDDPLERYGLSMNDFDQLLDKYQNEINVRDAIARIMGGGTSAADIGRVPSITRKEIVEVHHFMLKELSALVERFNAHPEKRSFDMKSVTIAVQALVGARVENKFHLTSEDIEAAVLRHHQELGTDPEFTRINVGMQSTMGQLMGSQFPVFG